MRRAVCLLLLEPRASGFVGAGHLPSWLADVLSNNALERSVSHRGPRLAAAPAAWPAAQLSR